MAKTTSTAKDRALVRALEKYMTDHGENVTPATRIYEKGLYHFERREIDPALKAVSFYVSHDGLPLYEARVVLGKTVKFLRKYERNACYTWRELVFGKTPKLTGKRSHKKRTCECGGTPLRGEIWCATCKDTLSSAA